MDDSPLRAEIVQLCSALGTAPAEVYLQTHKLLPGVADTEAIEDSIQLRAWYQKFRSVSPVVPAFILQRLETPVVTAVVALRLARALPNFPLLEALSTKLKLKHPMIAIVVAITVIAYIIIRLASTSLVGMSLVIIGMVMATIVAARLAVSLLSRLGRAPVRAYLAWNDASPGEDRTVEDFLLAIALYHRAAFNLYHTHALFTVLQKSDDLRTLIVEAELDPEELWATVRDRLEDELPAEARQAAGEHVAASVQPAS